jgi:hypothetical protein
MGKHNGKSRNTGGTRVGQALARRKQVRLALLHATCNAAHALECAADHS